MQMDDLDYENYINSFHDALSYFSKKMTQG